MYGAIWGDIVGSPFEFDSNNYKAKDFAFLSEKSHFTDDTVMTVAVADALMNVEEDADDDTIRRSVVQSMQTIGRHYPDSGYGGNFYHWMFSREPRPYGSYGNGSAMRVSPVAWLYDDLESVRRVARLTAEVTHNHTEGIRGAEAVASAIFLARTGSSKEEIRDFVRKEFGYDLSRTCDEIRPTYHMDETCQGSVPEAIIAFLESVDFVDAIRNAVSLGGDSDTIGAITGSIAEAYYGLGRDWMEAVERFLPKNFCTILYRFRIAAGREFDGDEDLRLRIGRDAYEETGW